MEKNRFLDTQHRAVHIPNMDFVYQAQQFSVTALNIY